MRVVPLASSSRGNATLVEFGRAGGLFGPTRLLVDAGLSARELTRRLEQIDVAPTSVTAILVSHEHDDHARGVERFSRRHGVPVLCSPGTLEALDLSPAHLAGWQALATGRRAEVGGVEVESFRVPHDAADPVGFVLEADGLRVGIATDLGHATASVVERLRGCQLLVVESNHDDGMLERGPYPWSLKQRVGGRLGHLSNREAAGLLRQVVDCECRAVILAHLSEKNNTPGLAERSAAAALPQGARRTRVVVARSTESSPPLSV